MNGEEDDNYLIDSSAALGMTRSYCVMQIASPLRQAHFDRLSASRASVKAKSGKQLCCISAAAIPIITSFEEHLIDKPISPGDFGERQGQGSQDAHEVFLSRSHGFSLLGLILAERGN